MLSRGLPTSPRPDEDAMRAVRARPVSTTGARDDPRPAGAAPSADNDLGIFLRLGVTIAAGFVAVSCILWLAS